jgi:hypothetical protein
MLRIAAWLPFILTHVANRRLVTIYPYACCELRPGYRLSWRSIVNLGLVIIYHDVVL